MVLLCRGRDCRKAKGYDKLCRLFGDARTVGCQKICKGPIIGLEIDGKPEWFSRIRSSARRQALKAVLSSGRVRKGLKKLRKKKRSGKLRGKVGPVRRLR